MATKSTRSSGTQHNARGVTQGTTLVGPGSGLPIDEIVDSAGKRRLAVDANFTAQTVQATVELDPGEDGVYIGDPDTGFTLQIEADGSINANVEVDAADGDNIAIHDSQGDELAINTDGSINTVISASNPGELVSVYNEVTAVAASVLTTVQTFTAPVAKVTYLQKIEVSGTNIAEYRIEINNVVQDKKRTYFGAELNLKFMFVELGTGLALAVGDVVTVKVIHARPDVGDFNSRIQVVEV